MAGASGRGRNFKSDKTTSMKHEIEYIQRLVLPSSGEYELNASGNSKFDIDFNRAIREHKPDGFEVDWSTKLTWPTDKFGFTWVKLYCTDPKLSLQRLSDKLDSANKEIERLRGLARQMLV